MSSETNVIVIIPMYNAITTIEASLESVLKQKNVNTKVIVVDHGSHDGCYELVKTKYEEIHNVRIIKLERIVGERRSASRPLNVGFKHAIEWVNSEQHKSVWFMRLDADDVLFSNQTLSNMIYRGKASSKLINGRLVLCHSELRTANYYSTKSDINTIDDLLEGGVYAFAHHATLISPELVINLLNTYGYCYMENTGYGEDLDFSIRLLEQCNNSEIVLTDETVMIKKLNGDTISNSIGTKDVIVDHLRIFKKHRSLSRFLLMKIMIWFSLDMIGKPAKVIRKFLQPPVLKYAGINPAAIHEVERRYNELDVYLIERSHEIN